MSRTPAAHLARLKCEFPQWEISGESWGSVFWARHRTQPSEIKAASVSELEISLNEAAWRHSKLARTRG